MKLSNSKSMRDADHRAIHVLGIPSTLLMTNAAKHLAKASEEFFTSDNRSAVIFCGPGNNGGDGIACAMYLMRNGASVRAFLVGDRKKMTADTLEMERRLNEFGGSLEKFNPKSDLTLQVRSAAVLVDAIFGIGFHGVLSGDAEKAVTLMNTSGVPVVSADIASGVEADTGAVRGIAVKAARTVTFSMAKPGHFAEPGSIHTGELSIADIGIPEEILADCNSNVFAVSESDVSLPQRNEISHKGDYGKLLIIGGSVGYTGAPVMCARAAMRSGAGLAYLGVPSKIYEIAAVKCDETMPFPLPCDEQGRISADAYSLIADKLKTCDICALGPGLGRSKELTALVGKLVTECEKPLVLDADALYALSQDMTVLRKAKSTVILTPHEGEFVRMGGTLTGNRIEDALRFVREHGCILVLKGHRTVIAFPDEEVYITTTGNAGMAKGGSGDVLTGIITALLGRLPVKEAVIT